MKLGFTSNSKTLIIALIVLCLGGLSGAIPFIIQPDGSLLGMSTSLLKRSPVDNYFWPGIFLLLVMVIWPLINIYGIITKKSWVDAATVSLGTVTMVWIVYETIMIRAFSPLQPFVFIIGLIMLNGGLKRLKNAAI